MSQVTLPVGAVFDNTPSDWTADVHDPPFRTELLDELLGQSRLDCVLATSQPATRYLLGGYYSHLFYHQDALGLSRYVPIVGYVRGRPDQSFYLGNHSEVAQFDDAPLWVGECCNDAWNSSEMAANLANLLRERGLASARIGIEANHLPFNVVQVLTGSLPGAILEDASVVLEELRAVKSPREIEKIQAVSVATVDSIVAACGVAALGTTKPQMYRRLRIEDAQRDLAFHYALIAMGPSLNRLPNNDAWAAGAAMSVDHGTEQGGYVGDLSRMAVLGSPGQELVELLADVDQLQRAAMNALVAGNTGSEAFAEARAVQDTLHKPEETLVLIHGVGLNQIDAPRCADFGSWQGPGNYADRPLRVGMVISVEAMRYSSTYGLIKLEDTGVITDAGFENLAPQHHDWVIVDA